MSAVAKSPRAMNRAARACSAKIRGLPTERIASALNRSASSQRPPSTIVAAVIARSAIPTVRPTPSRTVAASPASASPIISV